MVSLFIDSAVRAEVEPLLATGLFSGVTTNPAILDKAGLTAAAIPELVAWASDAGAERVFVQSWGATADEIVDRGRGMRDLGPGVVVKVPMSDAGLRAARVLSRDGEVLVTALHTATQVVPALASGATYIAPFVGRMTAVERNGVAEAVAMHRAARATGSLLQVLAGSLRTPQQILDLATAGIHHFTFAPAVWEAFFQDDPTLAAVENFERLSVRA
jgi:TalC/MipB family fructose-6-phosphate aldolase